MEEKTIQVSKAILYWRLLWRAYVGLIALAVVCGAAGWMSGYPEFPERFVVIAIAAVLLLNVQPLMDLLFLRREERYLHVKMEKEFVPMHFPRSNIYMSQNWFIWVLEWRVYALHRKYIRSIGQLEYKQHGFSRSYCIRVKLVTGEALFMRMQKPRRGVEFFQEWFEEN